MKKIEKVKPDYVVKTNPNLTGNILITSIFSISAVVFILATFFAIKSKSFLPALEFIAFSVVSIFMLFNMYSFRIEVYGNKFKYRKYFKSYELDVKDCTSYSKSINGYYEFSFPSRTIKVHPASQNFRQFFDKIRNRNNPFRQEEGCRWLKEYIKKNSALSCIRLVPDTKAKVKLTSTKVGGYPYWDLKKKFPVDENGTKMQLLCQINFSDIKVKNELLPEKGLLQFFIPSQNPDGGEMFGCDFAESSKQKNWKIVYHEEINGTVTQKQIEALGIIQGADNDFTPVLKTCVLKPKKSVSYIQSTESGLDELLKKAVKEFNGEDCSGDLFDLIGDSSENIYAKEIYDLTTEAGSSMLSHPSFCQYDPREDMSEKEAAYYDTVLLHLDEPADGEERVMMWGDGGQATFFINSKALKKLNFSKVHYSWDCF